MCVCVCVSPESHTWHITFVLLPPASSATEAGFQPLAVQLHVASFSVLFMLIFMVLYTLALNSTRPCDTHTHTHTKRTYTHTHTHTHTETYLEPFESRQPTFRVRILSRACFDAYTHTHTSTCAGSPQLVTARKFPSRLGSLMFMLSADGS